MHRVLDEIKDLISRIKELHILSNPYVTYNMITRRTAYVNKSERAKLENRFIKEKRRQGGISFPSAANQEHILLVRFNISNSLSIDDNANRSS